MEEVEAVLAKLRCKMLIYVQKCECDVYANHLDVAHMTFHAL